MQSECPQREKKKRMGKKGAESGKQKPLSANVALFIIAKM